MCHLRTALAGAVLLLLAEIALAAPAVATAATASAAALRTPPGGQLAISLQLEGDAQTSTLQLERRDVWRAGAHVVVHTAVGEVRQAPPATRFFTGRLAGVPGSDVVLAVDPSTGRMTGKASRGNVHWSLAVAPPSPTAAAAAAGVSSGLAARRIPAATGPTAAAAVARPRIRGCGKKAYIKPPGWTSTPMVAAAAAVKVSWSSVWYTGTSTERTAPCNRVETGEKPASPGAPPPCSTSAYADTSSCWPPACPHARRPSCTHHPPTMLHPPTVPALQPASTGPLQATITVDTDAEFFKLFGSVQDTINYVTLMTTCAPRLQTVALLGFVWSDHCCRTCPQLGYVLRAVAPSRPTTSDAASSDGLLIQTPLALGCCRPGCRVQP